MATVKSEVAELKALVASMLQAQAPSAAEAAVSGKAFTDRAAKAQLRTERTEHFRKEVVISDKGTKAEVIAFTNGEGALLAAYKGPRSYHPIGGRREVIVALREACDALLKLKTAAKV